MLVTPQKGVLGGPVGLRQFVYRPVTGTTSHAAFDGCVQLVTPLPPLPLGSWRYSITMFEVVCEHVQRMLHPEAPQGQLSIPARTNNITFYCNLQAIAINVHWARLA